MSTNRAVVPHLGIVLFGSTIAGLFVLIAWWYLAAQLEQYRATISKANLKQIGVALRAYHNEHNCFPPAYVRGPDGSPWHSWRTLLLPYLNEGKLYDEYNFNEPWNGPANLKLVQKRPRVYQSPLQRSSQGGVTGYVGVVSRRTMWPAYFSSQLDLVTDGTGNTIQLLEDVRSEIRWTEPLDLREHDVLAFLAAAPTPAGTTPPPQRFSVLMCDGYVRRISSGIERDYLMSLLTPRYRGTMVPNDVWPTGLLNEGVQQDRPLPAVSDLSQNSTTKLALTPRQPIDPTGTTLYCATSQIVWDQLRPAPGEPVAVTNTPPEVDDLNAHPFPPNALSSESFTAQINSASSAASGSRMSPEMVDRLRADIGATDVPSLVIECHLHKLVKYPEAMFRFRTPLLFGSGDTKSPVASFGWPGSQAAAGEMAVPALTVTIASYRSSEDFVVVLSSTSGRSDEVILARVAAERSLQETWAVVHERIASRRKDDPNRDLRSIDTLQIPVLAIGVMDEFRQLKNLAIPTERSPERYIVACRQSIQLKLDEFGAELISDEYLVVGENGFGPQEDPSHPRIMIFDQPFFMAMREQASDTPYFQAWIASPELMEPLALAPR